LIHNIFVDLTIIYNFALLEGFWLGDTSPLFYYNKMISQAKILGLIESLINTQKFFIVSLDINQSNKIRLLIDSMSGVQIDDCVKVSRAIEQGLNRETEDFELEVSSPGLDAPFRVKEQYLKNIGNPVEVFLKDGHTYQGTLIHADEKKFSIEMEKEIKSEGKKKKLKIKENVVFVYDEISKVKAVIKF
jgi:ribosome maturation factor RimP